MTRLVSPGGYGSGAEDGCDVSPHCLECPLPECKYVEPSYYGRWLEQQKYQRVTTLMEQGLTVEEVAVSLGLHKRTVSRLLLKMEPKT